MKQQIRNKKFNENICIKLDDDFYWKEAIENIINWILEIIEEYREMGIKITQRQLYYRLVGNDYIPNHIKVYSKICSMSTDMRYGGLLDWNAIEDRGRIPKIPNQWNSIDEIIETALNQFRLNRHQDQDCFVILGCEKDALSSVLQPICNKWHIPLYVNRGYSSASAMYELYQIIVREITANDRDVIYLYVGDHDPSGLDMPRDIEDRITEFLEADIGEDYHCLIEERFEVEQIALTQDQIKEFRLPKNPAKITDPRAKKYIKEFGRKSWEVDALPPNELLQIVEDSIIENIEIDKYDKWIEFENNEKDKLGNFLKDEKSG